jgi:large subunit ribosomal protein L17
MRHRLDHRKLSRTASHRKALLRNLVTALFMHERIETTLAKAKELRTFAEPLITKAIKLRKILPSGNKKPTAEVSELALRMRRMIGEGFPAAATMKGQDGDRFLSRRELVAFIVDDIAPRYLKRPGGYTRIRRLGFRKGDDAPIVILELVPGEAVKSEDKPKDEAPEKKKRAGFFRRSKAEAAAEDEKRDQAPAEEKAAKKPPKKSAKKAKE